MLERKMSEAGVGELEITGLTHPGQLLDGTEIGFRWHTPAADRVPVVVPVAAGVFRRRR